MILQPRVGQVVELRYRQSMRTVTGLHLRIGEVVAVGVGPGPINALIALDGGGSVVVPRGNLEAIVARCRVAKRAQMDLGL